ncbi:rubrerythrin-like domain-containing protein [Halopiger goleimassiliensis]|nr:rubrerythrin-like domain-containing protein [Halopiger goleimassiliensis]
MVPTESLEYECVQCAYREVTEDALLGSCRRCGGEMRNVEPVRD